MKKRFSDIIEVQVNDECTKYTVKYATGNTRSYNSKPSWFDWYADNSWSIIQDGFTVWAYSSTYIKATYKPLEMPWHTTNENPVEAEEVQEAPAEYEIVENLSYQGTVETYLVYHNNTIVFESYSKYDCVNYINKHTTPAASKASSPLKLGMQFFAQQKYTSANTSINNDKIPAVFSKLIINSIKLGINPANSIILDSGCGKYPEIISEYLLNSGCEYAGRDPYNQPEYINNIVFPTKCKNAEALKKHRIFTSSNVLNVIPGLDNRIAYINSIKDIMQAGEKLYITIYPGDSSGIGRPTNEDCWQENRKYKEYIPELEAAGFTSVKPKYGMLICEL